MTAKKTMLKFAAFAAALTLTTGTAISETLLSAIPVTASAEESYTTGTEGNLKYMKYSDHVEISGGDLSATSIEIPDTIEGVPVTAIGMNAFCGYSSVESVTIPDSVTDIGNYAFNMCTKLKSVKLPANLKTVGIRAFEYCKSLTTVEFPDRVVAFSSKVFDGTPWIQEQREKGPLVIINGALIDAQDAKGDVVIPSEVKYVAASAFARNMDITSVVYPEGVSKISDNTFFYCSNLTSVEAKGATTIENMAFAYCDKLTSLKLSENLKSIDSYGFSDAKGTATITFYGTKESWDAVEKSASDQFLQRATVVFEEYVPTSGPEFLKGDANIDGSVDMSDVVMVMQAYLNPAKYGVNGTSEDRITSDGEKAGDVDGNKGLSANDALLIQKFALKLIDKL